MSGSVGKKTEEKIRALCSRISAANNLDEEIGDMKRSSASQEKV
ncbi:MAG: hypothetical protein WCU00_03310 [Candidatus Latescibacterota bacterium]